MKPEKTFKFCEFCNNSMVLESPPPEEQYKQGVISLSAYSTILLDNFKTSKGHAVSHAANIEGDYCNINCLIRHLEKLRKNK